MIYIIILISYYITMFASHLDYSPDAEYLSLGRSNLFGGVQILLRLEL